MRYALRAEEEAADVLERGLMTAAIGSLQVSLVPQLALRAHDGVINL